MRHHVTVEQLRKVHQAVPFTPFTLHTADGRQFHIPHRDFLSQHPQGRTLMVWETADAGSILDLLLVTEIEIHASRGRGPRGRRGRRAG